MLSVGGAYGQGGVVQAWRHLAGWWEGVGRCQERGLRTPGGGAMPGAGLKNPWGQGLGETEVEGWRLKD